MTHCCSEEEHEQYTLQSMRYFSSQYEVALECCSTKWHQDWRGKVL